MITNISQSSCTLAVHSTWVFHHSYIGYFGSFIIDFLHPFLPYPHSWTSSLRPLFNYLKHITPLFPLHITFPCTYKLTPSYSLGHPLLIHFQETQIWGLPKACTPQAATNNSSDTVSQGTLNNLPHNPKGIVLSPHRFVIRVIAVTETQKWWRWHKLDDFREVHTLNKWQRG